MVYYRNKVANMEVKLRMKYIIADPDEKSGNDLKKILDCYKILDFKGDFKIFNTAGKNIRELLDIAFIRIDKIELNAVKFAFLLFREISSANAFGKVCSNSLSSIQL